MLNLNQLRVFYEVARSLNFSIAAERLSVTQPAVSKQIKMLEEFYDLKLFVIKRHKVSLTDEGRKVFVYASRIFELESQLEEMLSGLNNLEHGSLRIGTTKTYAREFIPALLPPFQRKYPNVIIELDEGSSLGITRSLLDFKNSLAIVAEIESEPDIIFKPLLLEEVVLVAAPNCPLASRGEIDFSDLKGQPIIMKEAGSGTSKIVHEHFSKQKIKPKIIAQSGNMEFIKGLVRQEKGVAFVVNCAVERELSRGDLIRIPMKGKPLLLYISIAFLKDYELPHAAKIFLQYLLPFTEQEDLPVGIQDIVNRIAN